MTTTEPLNDIQKAVLSSDRKLAKTLGLTPVRFGKVPKQETEFTHGQTGLVLGPDGLSAGSFEVKIFTYFSARRTEYILNDVFHFRKYEQLVDDKWIPAFKPELTMSSGAKLYVEPSVPPAPHIPAAEHGQNLVSRIQPGEQRPSLD